MIEAGRFTPLRRISIPLQNLRVGRKEHTILWTLGLRDSKHLLEFILLVLRVLLERWGNFLMMLGIL